MFSDADSRNRLEVCSTGHSRGNWEETNRDGPRRKGFKEAGSVGVVHHGEIGPDVNQP